MKKQLLPLVFLSFLALPQPVAHLTAAPADSSSATEDADRKFLENLERADAAKAPATETAPAPADIASPPAATVGTSRERDRTAQSKTSARRSAAVVNSEESEQASQPEEVADVESTPQEPPTRTTKITVARPLNGDRAHHHRGERRGFLHRLFGNVLSHHIEDW